MQPHINRISHWYNPDGSLRPKPVSDHCPKLAALLGARPSPALSNNVNRHQDLMAGLPILGSDGNLQTNNLNAGILKLLHGVPEASPPSQAELVEGLRLVGTEGSKMSELEKIVAEEELFTGTNYEDKTLAEIIGQINQHNLDAKFLANVRSFLDDTDKPVLHRYNVAQLIEDIVNKTGTYREIVEDITDQIPRLKQEVYEIEAKAWREAA